MSLEYDALRKRLIEQLTFFDENKMQLLDTYFPHDRFGYQERERYLHFLDRYVKTVETIVQQLNETSGSAIPKVLIGSEVSLFYEEYDEEDTLTICFPEKADPDSGKVSFLSPIASQILLRSVDDNVQLNTPQGDTSVTIRDIRFADW